MQGQVFYLPLFLYLSNTLATTIMCGVVGNLIPPIYVDNRKSFQYTPPNHLVAKKSI
jgi:hypothetical protein